jgi:AAA domain
MAELDVDAIIARYSDYPQHHTPSGNSHQHGRLTFRTLADWKATYRPPRWLIRRFLIDGAFDGFGGAEKSLKSYLLDHVAIAIASEQPLFMCPEFTVEQTGLVLRLTGEGGVDLVQDRIEHLCHGMYETVVDDVLERIVVSGDIAPMTSKHFADDLTAAIQKYDPVLVQVDPLYAYFGEDIDAGNVFATGPALTTLRTLTAGRATETAHHFTKAGADKLTLASFTQAGMREALDHWLLVRVKDADLDRQRFTLDMVRGARRGLAWARRAEAVLGPFDDDTLRHSGTPSFTFEEQAGDGGTFRPTVLMERISRFVETNPGGLTTRDILAGVKGNTDAKALALRLLVNEGYIRTEPGPRGAIFHHHIKAFQQ